MYVIGTAGHVDHGKTTLVQALTGINPDRLLEEKERGLTIELGFAWLTLPTGRKISIVDVPGHERFIKNMLAGVGGIDLALIVIAANESVMPQTIEHLAILDILHVKSGLVVISKVDLVDQEMVELVAAEVEDILKHTTLEGAPIVRVSAITGTGLQELKETLDHLLETTQVRKDSGRARLPIDRSFAMPGFGTVVTGTLIDGSLSVGMDVEILPSGKVARIRGLQSHHQKVDEASPGLRLAINLSGLSHDEIDRGDLLTIPGWLRPTIAMDVRLELLANAPRGLKHNSPVTFHTGATETTAKVRLLETDELSPGQKTWAQIRLETPLAPVKGDYFVIRSSGSTLGGGTVVDPYAKRHRRYHSPTLERLEIMETGTQAEILIQTLRPSEPASVQVLANLSNLSQIEVRTLLKELADDRRVIILESNSHTPGSLIYSAEGWVTLRARVSDSLTLYHKRHPLHQGMRKEELRSRLNISGQEFALVLPRLIEEGTVIEERNTIRVPQHQVLLSDGQRRLLEQYMGNLRSNPYSPPTDRHLDDDLLIMLVDEGKVVKVGESIIYESGVYNEIVDTIITTIQRQGKINVGQVRDQFNTSRKYALSLLEHLDQRHITRRVGDDRVLR